MSASRHRPSPLRLSQAQAGFTIIEVLATALIVALLGIAVSSALVSQSQASGDQQARSEANLLVNQDQDRLRGMTDQALSSLAGGGPSSRPVTSTGMSYTVTSSASYQSASGVSSCASSAIDYFKVHTTVSWTNTFGGSPQTTSADSLIARPVTGLLQTVVDNQLGAPLSGVSVTATPTGSTSGSGQSGSTDSVGCSLFAGLSPGSYTVTASLAGYVSQQDQSPASVNATVTNTGSNTANTVSLGLAGSLAATFKATSSNTSYAGQADALTYLGSGSGAPTLTQSATAVATHATSMLAGQTSLATPTSLYPWSTGNGSPSYTGNYSLYAGQCGFQNPFANGVASTNLATVNPGGSATATVQEPYLSISSVQANYNGTNYPITPRDIVLTYSNGGGCTDSYAATVATSSGGQSADGVTFGQPVPSTGWLADPGQPYAPSGDLSVCVDVMFNGSPAYGTVTTSNTSMTSANPVPTININSSGACPGITS